MYRDEPQPPLVRAGARTGQAHPPSPGTLRLVQARVSDAEQDDELIAAETSDEIVGAHVAPWDRPERAQHGVARGVAARDCYRRG